MTMQTASISHLPHIIAASLVNLIRETDDENETMKTIAAGGFKDITRIASSSPVMWQHICASNRGQILTLIDRYTEELNTMRSLIAERKEKRKSMISSLMPRITGFYHHYFFRSIA